MTFTAAEVYRDYEISSVPASGPHQVSKAEARALLTLYESLLGTIGLAYGSKVSLLADLVHASNTLAMVYNDGTPANNGMYQKSGASGTGTWIRIGDLPGGVIRLNVTGGTANAIIAIATETPSAPGNKLYLLTPTANNTLPVTITVNGGAAVSIKNALGSSLAANSLLNNSPVLMLWSVDHYQILISIPVDATGILNDALAAQEAAEDAQEAAEAAAAALGNQAATYDTLTQLAAATTLGGINAARTLGALAIGDDGDAILKKVATPAIIKPWHKPSNNAWFELMSTVGSLKFFGGKSSGSTGNVSANNQALKDIAQWAQERKEANCSTEMTFHAGVYDYNDNAFNLAQQNAVLRSVGQPILRYHGSDVGLLLDGMATASPLFFGRTGFRMLGQLTVQSNSAAGHAIIARAMEQDSVLDLKCGGGSALAAGLHLEFGVCPTIRYTCSSNLKDENGNAWWADGVAPLYGLYVTDLGSSLGESITPNSFSTLHPIIEGVPYGIWADTCDGLQIREGAIEGCTINGLTILANCHGNNVWGTDFESNTQNDVYCVGADNNFYGVNCGGVFLFGTSGSDFAVRNRIIGGRCNKVVFAAGTFYNSAETTFNSLAGFISDAGTYNRTKGSFDAGNAGTAMFYHRPQTSVTLSGSPFQYQNTTGDNLMVSVSGGTVSAINITPQGTGSGINVATSGIFYLAPRDILSITYSSAPTVKKWGV